MKIILFNGNRLQKMVLPKKMEGSFWLTDELNNNNNIVNIESSNNKWIMKHNEDTRIIFSNSYVDTVELMPNYFYFLEHNNKKLLLYTERVLDQTIKYYKVEKNSVITIGKDNTTDGITYYSGSVDLIEPNQTPHSTLFAIEERIGEVNTYSNCETREFVVNLPKEAEGTELGDWYKEQIEKNLRNELAQKVSSQLNDGIIDKTTYDKQLDFYKNIKVQFG